MPFHYPDEENVPNLHLEMTYDELQEEIWGVANDELLFEQDGIPKQKTTSKDNSTIQGGIEFMKCILYFICLWQCLNFISDHALEKLLTVLATIFTHFGKDEAFAAAVAVVFPTTMYKVRKWMNLQQIDFQRFVVCPECKFVYSMDDLLYKDGRKLAQPKTCCDHERFKRGKFARPCGSTLMKKVMLSDGKITYYPLKLYCYRSITKSLTKLLSREGVIEQCDLWKGRNAPDNLYADIYDGDVWKEFHKVNGEPFLLGDHGYALMCNIDWFQPYSRRSDVSVGALYLTLLNLPREVRFRKENVIIVGIIPSLHSEPEYLRYFLNPMVSELKELWNPGKMVKLKMNSDDVKIRAALICTACDIPAARKFNGFIGHNGKYGCSKCLKEFKGGVGRMDYSGFNRNDWMPRGLASHRRKSMQLLDAATKTDLKKLESSFGCKYSPLVELDYFNPVRFHVVDPMHNLYLGTAKKIFEIWVEKEILSRSVLDTIQQRVKELKSPGASSRLPHGIGKNWSNFNAHEWKEWVLVFSMYALHGLLPDNHMNMWETFVLACKKITKPLVSKDEIMCANRLFETFGKRVEQVLGVGSVTCNMHLHCHLEKCIQDYGSIYGFWLFSYERYNGILGSIHTNGRCIEVQLMKKFLMIDTFLSTIDDMPDECVSVLEPLLLNKQKYSSVLCSWEIIAMPTSGVENCVGYWKYLSHIHFPKVKASHYFTVAEMIYLTRTYGKMYPGIALENMTENYWRYSHVYIGQEHFASEEYSATDRCSLAMASWVSENGKLIDYFAAFRPCRIKYYCQHTLDVDGELFSHLFAYVEWPCRIDDNLGFSRPVTAWRADKNLPRSEASFIPVQRLQSKAASVKRRLSGYDCLIVAEVEPKLYL